MSGIQFVSGVSKVSRLRNIMMSAPKPSAGQASTASKVAKSVALVAAAGVVANKIPPWSQSIDNHGVDLQIAGGAIGVGTALGVVIVAGHVGTAKVGLAALAGAALCASTFKTGTSALRNHDKDQEASKAENLAQGIGVLEYTGAGPTPTSEEEMGLSGIHGALIDVDLVGADEADGTVVDLLGKYSNIHDALRALRDDPSVGAVVSHRGSYVHVQIDYRSYDGSTVSFNKHSGLSNIFKDWTGGSVIAIEDTEGNTFEGHKNNFHLVEKWVAQ